LQEASHIFVDIQPPVKLAETLNNPYGYQIQLPIKGIDDLPSVDPYVYVNWNGSSGEATGWYRV